MQSLEAKPSLTGFVNQREIMVNAVQRSGHHAFIDWLLMNRSRHLFLNCPKNDRFFRRGFINNNPEVRFVNDLDLSLDKEMAGDLTPKELLVYNAENTSTEDALKIFASEKKSATIGLSKAEFFVVWIRDPFNNLASLCQRAKGLFRKHSGNSRYQEGIARVKLCCDLWVDHFAAFKGATAGRNDFVPVLYNNWLDGGRARQDLARRFDISSEYSAEHTVQWGGGSSFVAHSEGQVAPQKEELETRWLEVNDLPEFRELFRDERFRAAVLEFRELYRSPALDRAYAELVG